MAGLSYLFDQLFVWFNYHEKGVRRRITRHPSLGEE